MDEHERFIREKCLLGWMLIEPEKIPKVEKEIKASKYTFSSTIHQEFFDAIVALYDTDPSKVDLVTLRDELKRRDQYHERPTVEDLAFILEVVPNGEVGERCLYILSGRIIR